MNRIETLAGRRYTIQYAQPEAYRFCQDSVLAPLLIARDLENVVLGADFRILDLGAGCGVMGLELAHAIGPLPAIDFVEVQPEFRPYFETNRDRASRASDRFLELNWRDIPERTYDLVVANPPYFDPREGSLGASLLSNRCRFFLDDTFESLVASVRRMLKPGGRAYLLVKNGKSHGREPMASLRTLCWDCEVESIADVRGTNLVRVIAPG